MSSKIEWLQHPAYKPEVWNPVTGCTKIAAGCKHCYAATNAKRFFATLYDPVSDPDCDRPGKLRPRKFTDVRTHPDRLEKPLRWRKPRLVFANSMSDLFHPDVPDEFIAAVYGIMAATPQHRFVILTKRIERAREWFAWIAGECRLPKIEHPNVGLGVSVSTQADADAALPVLMECPTALRVVSVEPLLEAVSLYDAVGDWWEPANHPWWLLLGGESGPKARPCDTEWLRDVALQGYGAGAPVFIKQLGSAAYDSTGEFGAVGANVTVDAEESDLWRRLTDPKGADPAEWPENLRAREYPEEWLR